MTKPWDHAAGALMLAEAGGQAIRLNGEPYGPAGRLEAGIIAAASTEVVAEAKAVYEMVEMPLLVPARLEPSERYHWTARILRAHDS